MKVSRYIFTFFLIIVLTSCVKEVEKLKADHEKILEVVLINPKNEIEYVNYKSVILKGIVNLENIETVLLKFNTQEYDINIYDQYFEYGLTIENSRNFIKLIAKDIDGTVFKSKTFEIQYKLQNIKVDKSNIYEGLIVPSEIFNIVIETSNEVDYLEIDVNDNSFFYTIENREIKKNIFLKEGNNYIKYKLSDRFGNYFISDNVRIKYQTVISSNLELFNISKDYHFSEKDIRVYYSLKGNLTKPLIVRLNGETVEYESGYFDIELKQGTNEFYLYAEFDNGRKRVFKNYNVYLSDNPFNVIIEKPNELNSYVSSEFYTVEFNLSRNLDVLAGKLPIIFVNGLSYEATRLEGYNYIKKIRLTPGENNVYLKIKGEYYKYRSNLFKLYFNDDKIKVQFKDDSDILLSKNSGEIAYELISKRTKEFNLKVYLNDEIYKDYGTFIQRNLRITNEFLVYDFINKFKVVVYDIYGNQTIAEKVISYRDKDADLTIEFDTLSNFVSRNSIFVTVELSDQSVSKGYINITGEFDNHKKIELNFIQNIASTLLTLYNGTNDVTIVVEDGYGKTTKSDLYQFISDTEKPNITFEVTKSDYIDNDQVYTNFYIFIANEKIDFAYIYIDGTKETVELDFDKNSSFINYYKFLDKSFHTIELETFDSSNNRIYRKMGIDF